MAGEGNQVKWVGIRPTDPEEAIPVKQGTAANLKAEVEIAANQSVEVVQDTLADLNATIADSYAEQGSGGDQFTDPTSGSILIDTGELVAGRYDFHGILTCNVAHEFYIFRHRNQANSATLHDWYFYVQAFIPMVFTISNWNVATDERMRMEIYANLTGKVITSLWWTRRT